MRRVDDAIADCEEAAPLSKGGYDSNMAASLFQFSDIADSTDAAQSEKRAQQHAAAMAKVNITVAKALISPQPTPPHHHTHTLTHFAEFNIGKAQHNGSAICHNPV